MPKKRNENETWGENESWSGDDEGWDYKPQQTDIRSQTASQRREYAERVSKKQSGNRPYDERPRGNRPSAERSRSEYPSGGARPRPRGNPSAGGNSRSRQPQKRSVFVYFYIGILLIAVAVCLLLFAMAFETITAKPNPILDDSPESPGIIATPAPDSLQETREVREYVGMITGLAESPDKITVINIESRRDETFEVPENVNIRNRYGTAITYGELYEGMILDVGYHPQTKALVSLEESSNAWELAYKTNVEFDLETSTVTVGNDEYTYNIRTLITYKDEPYQISQITQMDTVSLTGYGDNIWSIRVEGSHGFLEIENMDAVIDGKLSVGTLYMSLADVTEPIPLAEGPHRVIIEGQNIETYMQDITVNRNETVTVSLIDAELRPGSLLVTSSEPDSEIFIDGVPVTEPGPAEVSFGTHVIRVEKFGFTPMEQTVEVDKAYQEINVDLSRLLNDVQVRIYTLPTPAEIYVDNVFMGLSPWTGEASVGTHTITARLTGYDDSTIQMDVVSDGDNNRTLILRAASTDPLSNLPVPSGLQPVVDEPVADPPFDPFAPATAAPVSPTVPPPSIPYAPPTEPPSAAFPAATPPPADITGTGQQPANPFNTPQNTAQPIFEEDFSNFP